MDKTPLNGFKMIGSRYLVLMFVVFEILLDGPRAELEGLFQLEVGDLVRVLHSLHGFLAASADLIKEQTLNRGTA